MIRNKAQLQAAEKALSKKQMEVLQTLRKGAFIKSKSYLCNYHTYDINTGKDIGSVSIATCRKLHRLGFLSHKKEWPYLEDSYYLNDLSWIQ